MCLCKRVYMFNIYINKILFKNEKKIKPYIKNIISSITPPNSEVKKAIWDLSVCKCLFVCSFLLSAWFGSIIKILLVDQGWDFSFLQLYIYSWGEIITRPGNFEGCNWKLILALWAQFLGGLGQQGRGCWEWGEFSMCLKEIKFCPKNTGTWNLTVESGMGSWCSYTLLHSKFPSTFQHPLQLFWDRVMNPVPVSRYDMHPFEAKIVHLLYLSLL